MTNCGTLVVSSGPLPIGGLMSKMLAVVLFRRLPCKVLVSVRLLTNLLCVAPIMKVLGPTEVSLWVLTKRWARLPSG